MRWNPWQPDPPPSDDQRSAHKLLIEKIKTLKLESGDVIVLLSPRILSDKAYERLRYEFGVELGIPKNKIIILEEGMDLKVIKASALREILQGAE